MTANLIPLARVLSRDESVLGIEIDEHEVRIAHVRYRGSKVSVTHLLQSPIPLGSVMAGVVRQPGNVAITIGRMLDGAKIATRKAVIGLSSDSCHLRTIAVPPVPGHELMTVVAGEVDHYGMVRSRGAVHGFFPLRDPTEPSLETIPIALFLAEEDAPRAMRDLADRLGLEVVALEPAVLGHLRATVAAQKRGSDHILMVLVQESSTDLVLTIRNQIVFYRRIDTGIKQILTTDPESRLFAGAATSNFGNPSTEDTDRALNNLTVETRRSLDYLTRQYGEDGPARVVVHCSHESVDFVVGELEESVGMPCELARPIAHDWDVVEDRRLYLGPIGLALRSVPEHQDLVPLIDLFSKERSAFQLKTKKRNLAGSFVVSGIALVIGFIGHMLFMKAADEAEADVAKLSAQVQSLDSEIEARKTASAKYTQDLNKSLALSYPVDRVADAVASSVIGGVRVVQIDIGKDGAANMQFLAPTEGTMIQTVEALTRHPALTKVQLDSFQRDERTRALSFRVIAQTMSAESFAEVRP
jgi:Tfp pilus assembly PilM family ATPase